ncbi:hypothetical protein HaLaN_14349 [Haematococcus lacustris]|uniref:Uncharacterized protein n=1 Tax=Haematococcus lacustris TaxID=44745 RepID=A0A699Z4V4_HAELA|nr:hypothetical protein HaLaN_14349 [Haematococcus lacustris]
MLAWSGVEAQLFIKLACGYTLNADSPVLQASDLDVGHVEELKAEAGKQRRLLGMEEGSQSVAGALAEQREFVFNPATQIGVGIDPGVTQAVRAASGVWDHLAAASSAGTPLVANLKHVTLTLAIWDAVWEVNLDPKTGHWSSSLKKLEEVMAEVSMERHGQAKQLVVFFGAATIGTREGWGAEAVLRACSKVVSRPRGTD